MHVKAILTVNKFWENYVLSLESCTFQYPVKHSYYLKVFTKFLVARVQVGEGWSLQYV